MTPPTKACTICGHRRDEHSYAREDDFACDAEGCDCNGFSERHGGMRYVAPEDRPAKGERVLERLHHHEPVFVIRAGDLLAPQALAAYAELARKAGLDEHARGVEARAVQFLRWQSENRDLVRRPD